MGGGIENPYAPPRARVADADVASAARAAATQPLYSVRQIAVSTVLAGAVAATWLIRANFLALGDSRRAWQTVAWGVVVFIVLGLATWLLPEKFPNIVFFVVQYFGAKAVAERQFGAVLRAHQAAGGALHSWWRVVGIGLLCLTVSVALIFGVVFAFISLTGEKF